MKKIIFVFLFTGILFTALNTYSSDKKGWYLSGRIGANYLNDINHGTVVSSNDDGLVSLHTTFEDQYDIGYILDAGIGYDFEKFRIESQISYQRNDLDSLNLYSVAYFESRTSTNSASYSMDLNASRFSLLFNGYYDFFQEHMFHPFIMGGLGISNVDFDFDIDDTVFAYQLGGGISLDINEKTVFDITYTFYKTADPEFGSNNKVDYSGHSLSMGLRYYF